MADLHERIEKFGCHCELEPGMEPDGCVLDYGMPQDCVHTRNINAREECEHWKPIRVLSRDTLSTLEAENARLRDALTEIAQGWRLNALELQNIARTALSTADQPKEQG